MRERSMAPQMRRELGTVRRLLSSPGRELDPAVRSFMEERFAGPVSRVPGTVQASPDSLACLRFCVTHEGSREGTPVRVQPH